MPDIILTKKDGTVSHVPADPVRICISQEEAVSLIASEDFRVSKIELVDERSGRPIREMNPFHRPLPWPTKGFRKKVHSGVPQDDTKGHYKLSGEFADKTAYDPIIIINP